ncbi:MAG TPA: hypothetical protein PK079_14950 [Leptospiraceae bacterium]|nr:hypothetical protein [Leptospiraceae bacterium]HMX35513.1 hypothetical protein [Leptospiraceae bacterium]HMY33500.1 hypothetical protein [Leptospiraceae bacterium]HMZ65632.1 hypothetical protein [Leptospiraceae bacterium]HNA10108.1 hypothetical protein [Leptospiraceae bacterium]
MRISFSILLILLVFNCASSVDFQPDSDFTEENPIYSKQKPEEVEIVAERPVRDFKMVGTVIFRNFVDPIDMKSELYTLQMEMFRRKIDGVWIYKKTLETIPPLIINTQNGEGMTVAYTEANREMGKLVGYPYRYRKINDNNPKKVR